MLNKKIIVVQTNDKKVYDITIIQTDTIII